MIQFWQIAVIAPFACVMAIDQESLNELARLWQNTDVSCARVSAGFAYRSLAGTGVADCCGRHRT